MSKSDYIPTNDDAFGALLNQVKTNLGNYATLLGLTPAQIAAVGADADYFGFTLASQRVMQGAGAQWTGWKDLTREGGAVPPTGSPVAPVLPEAVPAVAPGVEPRLRALVRSIKAHPGYNASIGRALGLEGAEPVPVDPGSLVPKIEVVTDGDAVLVLWGWQGARDAVDMIEIQVDRGDGKGYQLLTYDTTPNYTDTAPLPAMVGRWKYRAIYRVGDARVGRWSAEVSVVVGG